LTDIDHTPDPLENKVIQTLDRIDSQDELEPYWDFCEEYQMEDEIQSNLFNDEFNQPHLRWIFIDPETLKPSPSITKDLLNAISTRIYNYSHINLFIFGPTDSGKSELSQSLGDYYQKEFLRLHGLEVDLPIAFSDADIDTISPNLEYGAMLIRDESSSVTGDDSGILKEKIGNLIRAIRCEQNSFIYVNPDVVEVPLVDYYLRTAGKKGIFHCENCNIEYLNMRRCPECYSDMNPVYSKCKTRAIVYVKQIDPLSNKAAFRPLGRIIMSLHTNHQLREIYKHKKKENAIWLKQQSGLVGVHRDRVFKEAQILAKECFREGINTKIGMELQLLRYNNQFTMEEAHQMIGGTKNHNKLLFEETMNILSKLQNHEQLEDSSNSEEESEVQDPFAHFKEYRFPYSKSEIIKRSKKNANFRNIERDFEIYKRKVDEGLIPEDLLPYYPNLTDISSLYRIVNKVQGLINQVGGRLFEKDYVKHLQTLYEDKVVHDGRKGCPDAHVIVEEKNELHVFSLKNLSTNYISRGELTPEQDFAFENRFNYNKVVLYIIANINYKIYVREETDLSLTSDIIFQIPTH